MHNLRDIKVLMDSPMGAVSKHGNAAPILHEILYALQRLQHEGQTTIIDLRAIPFGPGDEVQLLETLGRGEVEVKLDALGRSEIWETQFSGVWVIEHKNPDGERIAMQIEITPIPEILQAQSEDISASISRLDDQLNPAAGLTDVGGQDG